MSERSPITTLAQLLLEGGYVGSIPSSRSIYHRATSARLPSARRGENGRWTIDPRALPEIARSMGLHLPAPPAAICAGASGAAAAAQGTRAAA